ncbi:allatostatin-A receptor-like [Lytechinus pictus]|uniref:allatostatin-A receptor-like n=1 Tax=Lytechinus pictus TaxID=7653 RepID=UPI0030B9E705
MADCSRVFLSISCNLSMSSLPDDLTERLHTTSTIAFACMVIIILFGLVGNLLIVYIVCTKPKMITVHNVHIVNLAVIDILFLCVCSVVDVVGMGVIAYHDIFLNITSSQSAGIIFVQTLTFTASCGTLMALAFQRYLAIVNPLENKKRRTVKNANILQAIVWTVPLLLGVIVAVLESDLNTHIIAEGISLYQAAFFFSLLIVAMVICHIAIYRSVREREMVEGGRVARWQQQRNMRMLRMVNLLVFTFLIARGFWLIYGLYVNHTGPRSQGGHVEKLFHDVMVQIFARIGCAVNSALNPVIYGMLTPDFHRHLIQIIFHPFAGSAPQRRGTMDRDSTYIVTSSSANTVSSA